MTFVSFVYCMVFLFIVSYCIVGIFEPFIHRFFTTKLLAFSALHMSIILIFLSRVSYCIWRFESS